MRGARKQWYIYAVQNMNPSTPASDTRPLAWVIGGSRGIGRAIALRLARDGFDIAVHCRSRRDLADGVCAEIAALSRNARVLEFDVADRDACASTIAADIEASGASGATGRPSGCEFVAYRFGRGMTT